MPNSRVPDHFLVFVPGYMGSKLRDPITKETRWIDLSRIPLNPFQIEGWLDRLMASLAWPSALEPAGILDDIVILQPWAKMEEYSRLRTALSGMGYKVDPARYAESDRDYFEFPYDWRQSNRDSGKQLAAALARWSEMRGGAKAWVIGHSNGGVVARWAIEKEGAAAIVDRLFLFGSPYDGTPKAMRLVTSGIDTFLRMRFSILNIQERTRALFRSFPSAYQIIPVADPFLRGTNNEVLDPFDGAGWLPPEAHAMLKDGKELTESLKVAPSVETICFIGVKRPTATFGIVPVNAQGAWGPVDWQETDAGDATIPQRSAAHPGARQVYPVVAGHGDIYVNDAALTALRWELFDKYQTGARAVAATADLQVEFLVDADFCAPGAPLGARATVRDAAGLPVNNAEISLRMLWRGPLPGAPAASPQAPGRAMILGRVGDGEYARSLAAPATEGFYTLLARVERPGVAPVLVEELFGVEAPPGP